MQDAEFEKQVREKMDELEFNPSSSVWNQVERELQQDEKRRKPLAWFVFALGLLLTAGGFYLIHIQHPAHQELSGSQTQHAKQGPESNKNLHPSTSTVMDNRNTSRPSSLRHSEAPFTGEQGSGKSALHEQGKSLPPTQKGLAGSRALADARRQQLLDAIAEEQLEAGQSQSNPGVSAAPGPGAAPVAKASPSPGTNPYPDSMVSVMKKTTSGVSNPSGKSVGKKTEKNNRWRLGGSVRAGISDIYQKLFEETALTNSGYYTSSGYLSYATNSAAYAPPPTTYTPSEIHSGFSYGAGILAEKSIAERLYFTGGLNYHYYSTSIQTGDATAYNPSLAFFSRSNSPYYTNGKTNQYTNHYHFLELPVGLGIQITKSRKLPLYWELGLTVSQLLSTDALHFDYVSGTYFRDDRLFNNTQLSGNTAIYLGFSNGSKLFKVGPSIQYGFTNLLSQGAGKQHLFYAGMRIAMLLNK